MRDSLKKRVIPDAMNTISFACAEIFREISNAAEKRGYKNVLFDEVRIELNSNNLSFSIDIPVKQKTTDLVMCEEVRAILKSHGAYSVNYDGVLGGDNFLNWISASFC